MPEQTGKQTPGVEGDLWDTPAKKACAVVRIGRWRSSRPAPLKRLDLAKQHGPQRPLSIATLGDRARQAGHLQARQPMADTTGDPHADGLRPTRRCADALDPCGKLLRQHTSATWIWAGDRQGVFDHRGCAWLEPHIPMHTRVLSQWLRSGCVARGVRVPTTAGVPHGGSISPVISTRGWDGLEAVLRGGSWHRRVHHSHAGRGADDVIGTATAREVWEEPVLPRIRALLAGGGIRLSPTKTVIPPISQGLAG